MLSRWEDRGFVERIERGKYLIIPLESVKGKYTLHEFVIASHLVQPSAIAYWSALHYHGLTEQIPITVFVQTTARKKKNQLEVFGVDYRIVRVKPEKFFGFKKEWVEETPIIVTDREKTVIDCLDRPEYAGGVIEVAKALESGSLDPENLSRYARMIGNSAVVRRLGYLSERVGIPLDLPLPTSRNYLLLDPRCRARERTIRGGDWSSTPRSRFRRARDDTGSRDQRGRPCFWGSTLDHRTGLCAELAPRSSERPPYGAERGTGIRKVFIENYRFSDDLDFTLLEPYEKEALQEAVKDAVSRAREESGIRFEEDIGIVETATGFRATALFRIIPHERIHPDQDHHRPHDRE